MRLHSMRVTNLGPFFGNHEVRFGNLPTIVGKNDTGKSHLLNALGIFFEEESLEPSAVNSSTSPDDSVVIDISFASLPNEVELEKDVKTSLAEEMLVDSNGFLRIKKTYSQKNLKKPTISIVANDFEDERFAGLALLTEAKLNDRLAECGLDVKKSGGGITNKSRRDKLRTVAKEMLIGTSERELVIELQENIYKRIAKLLPQLSLFRSDTRLGVGETGFQKEFRAIVEHVVADTAVKNVKEEFIRSINDALQNEIDKIFEHLKNHTDEIANLQVVPDFSWEKAVQFDIVGRDTHGIEQSLERRGAGVRRLLMVSFFQYLAERDSESDAGFVFAVEEPENCLHPSLQRDLVTSFGRLLNRGCQVIVTSHSPVFAGASPIEDLALVTRVSGRAAITQGGTRDTGELASQIAEELGVEPSDQITGYKACVFVEGWKDISILKTVASKLKDAGEIPSDFDQANVGFLMCGGADNLRHWINLRAIKRLNRHFGGVLDSDKTSDSESINQRKLNCQKECEADGGKVFILRKRAMENYIHDNAIVKSGRTLRESGPFVDMKNEYGENVFKAVDYMNAEEILQMDRYEDNGVERHELKEIIDTFLSLPKS